MIVDRGSWRAYLAWIAQRFLSSKRLKTDERYAFAASWSASTAAEPWKLEAEVGLEVLRDLAAHEALELELERELADQQLSRFFLVAADLAEERDRAQAVAVRLLDAAGAAAAGRRRRLARGLGGWWRAACEGPCPPSTCVRSACCLVRGIVLCRAGGKGKWWRSSRSFSSPAPSWAGIRNASDAKCAVALFLMSRALLSTILDIDCTSHGRHRHPPEEGGAEEEEEGAEEDRPVVFRHGQGRYPRRTEGALRLVDLAIKKYVEAEIKKGVAPRLLNAALKQGALKGKLIQVKGSYKLSLEETKPPKAKKPKAAKKPKKPKAAKKPKASKKPKAAKKPKKAEGGEESEGRQETEGRQEAQGRQEALGFQEGQGCQGGEEAQQAA